MTTIAASGWLKPLAIVPCLSNVSASPVFTQVFIIEAIHAAASSTTAVNTSHFLFWPTFMCIEYGVLFDAIRDAHAVYESIYDSIYSTGEDTLQSSKEQENVAETNEQATEPNDAQENDDAKKDTEDSTVSGKEPHLQE